MNRITGWKLIVYDENGNENNLMDIPDSVAQVVDDWLTELEEEE